MEKRYIWLILFCFAASQNIFSQSIKWEWAQKAGSNASEEGRDVTTGPAGNVYVTGIISGNGNNFNNTTINSLGGKDIFIAKYNSSGELQWVTNIGSSSTADDESWSITADSSGNVYVCGFIKGTVSIAGLSSITTNGGRDIFLVKYNTLGTALWAKNAGSSTDDEAWGVTCYGDKVYITGYFTGTASFGSLSSISSSGSSDVFLAAYDAVTGLELFVKKGAGSGTDAGKNIFADASGVYITGTYKDASIDFSGTSGGALSNSGVEDIFIVKYNHSGNEQWKTRASGIDEDISSDLVTDNSSLYITGYFNSQLRFYNSSGGSAAATLNPNSGYDAFLVKYNKTSGNVSWALSENGTGDERAWGITINSEGNIYCSGDFMGTLPLGVKPDITAEAEDIYITMYDPAGNIFGGIKAGGSNTEQIYGLTIAKDNSGYLTGFFKSDPAKLDIINISTTGNRDILIAKFSCNALAGVASGSTTICEGDFAVIKLSGSTGNIEWQFSPASLNSWNLIPGAVNDSLIVNPTTNTDYRAKLTFGGCFSDSSTIITVNVTPRISNNIISSDQTICIGSNANIVTGTSPTGGTGAYNYTWMASPDSINWSDAPGTNSLSTYTPGTLTQSTYYKRVVSSGPCIGIYSDSSNVIKITVLTSLSNNSISTDQIICEGQSPSTLTGTIPAGGDGTYLYKWLESTDSLNWVNAQGTFDQKDYLPGIINSTQYYKRIVESSVCAANYSSESNIITIKVLPKLAGNNISSNQIICSGNTSAILSGSIPTGGNSVYSFLWEYSTDSVTWIAASGINDQKDYSPGMLNSTAYFRRIIVSAQCSGNEKSISNIIKVTVLPPVINNNISSSQSICSGSMPAQLTGSSPSGGTGSFLYLWKESTDSINWTDATSANNNINYSSGILTATTYYLRIVNSGTCTSISNTVKIEVLPEIKNNNISQNQILCEGIIPTQLTGLRPIGGNNSYSYLWKESSDSLNWQPAAGINNLADYLPASALGIMFYKREVTSGACSSTSEAVSIRINILPQGFISGMDSICPGESFNITTILLGTLPWTILYTNNSDTFSIKNITVSPYNFNVTPDSSSVYTLISVSDYQGCNAVNISGQANVTVQRMPMSLAGNDDKICGLSYTLNATPSIGTGYWQSTQGITFLQGQNIPNAEITASDQGDYTLTWIEDYFGCIGKDEVKISFYHDPDAANAGYDSEVYFTDQATLSAQMPVVGQGSWTVTSGNAYILSAASNNSPVQNLSEGENIFKWTVTNGPCSPTEDEVMIYMYPFFIPSGFSPNGDGVNDNFEIRYIDKIQNSLSIYDRWGTEIFSASPYQNTWNGYDKKDRLVPDDTYYYTLKTGEKAYSGYIIVKRK